jgi:hypothetical protein
MGITGSSAKKDSSKALKNNNGGTKPVLATKVTHQKKVGTSIVHSYRGHFIYLNRSLVKCSKSRSREGKYGCPFTPSNLHVADHI